MVEMVVALPGDGSVGSQDLGPVAPKQPWLTRPKIPKGRVLLVEDDELIRESIAIVLDEAGYEFACADNGREALRRLYNKPLPDLIVLDLIMPIMDGWEFRIIQKDDPKLSLIPVVAISADGSAQAASISAAAYLRKPIDSVELLATIERVILEDERAKATRIDETERLASLGRMAAAVGHEINNPLTFILLNLRGLREILLPVIPALGVPSAPAPPAGELDQIRSKLADVPDLLEECVVGGERIRETVGNLQRLSRQDQQHQGPVDIHKVINQSVSMVWNQIRHRARLVKTFGKIPFIKGNEAALGQVFLNLLVNASQAMPETNTAANEIRISTSVIPGENGSELVVEISDTGKGMTADVLSHVFEPFYTTKPFGGGTGLGLSISRQTVTDHGGRIFVESRMEKGTVFRVFLPVDGFLPASPSKAKVARAGTLRGVSPAVDGDRP